MSKQEIINTAISSHNNLLTLFDEQFSIQEFQEAMDEKVERSSEIIESARSAIRKAAKRDDNESRYFVDMSDEIRNSIETGEVELVTGKDGELYAILRGEKGQFSDWLPIKEELKEEGVTTEALQLALQVEAIRTQLKKIINDIKTVEERVFDVAKGQRNDRLGLFYSGLSMYVESKAISDTTLKRDLLVQALKSINDAKAQVIQDARNSLDYLINEKYDNSKNKTEKIREHIGVLRQCYEVISKAAFLKAIIYQDNNEVGAMLSSLSEYGRFLERMIMPYAGKLSELDKSDRFISKGKWGAIAESLCACNELREKIASGAPFLLSMGGEENVDG